ncbi:MAG: efflux RND transporter permease subunit [Planctomycetaceae bacterium]|nr:efflux RND transporter permease subunit [Planctomycetaceae bacterium]
MIQPLVEFSLRFRGIVVALACVVIAHGLGVAGRAKLDVFPEFAPPQVILETEAPGLSTEQVEQLVTRPVENAVNGVGNLASIRSQSIQGFSLVVAIFRDDTDVMRARQLVGERLTQVAGQLPAGVRAPVMAPLTSSTSLVLVLGLRSEKRTPMELRTFADWTLRPRLLGVPGVASIVRFGGEVREIQVQLRPDRLLAYGLSVNDVIAAAREASGVFGAGFVETESQRIAIRTEGQSLTPEAVGDVVVSSSGGAVLHLRDVARVVDGPEPKLGDALVNGEPGVLIQVWAQYGTNTKDVTEAVEEALKELSPALEAAGTRVTDPPLFRPADFIDHSIRNINRSLLVGGVLVAVVLAVFLFNLRTAFISLTAIPLSLLVAVILLERLGATLNTLTLGGLAIAIGEVVDDAIIDVENIVRRLRLNRAEGSPRSAFRVVLEASLEVRGAVVYATFIVALVFLPVLAMGGVQGKMFAPLAMAYILATLASLLVALTVTPALSLLLLAKAKPAGEPAFLRTFKGLHLRVLEALSVHPRWVLAFPVLLCAAAVPMILSFGGELLPEFQEGDFIIQMTSIPGTSAPEMIRIGRSVSKDLLSHPHIRTISLQVGRAELGEDTVGTDFGEYQVTLKDMDGVDIAQLQEELSKDLNAKYPGVKFAVKTFVTERIEETISGTKAPFGVKVFGNDLDLVEAKAAEVEEALAGVEGATGVQFLRPDEPQLVVRLDPERLRQFGLRPVEVLEAIRTGTQGLGVGQTYEGSQVVDIVVKLDEAERRDPESIGGLLLRNREGATVALDRVAEVYLSTGRHSVLHDGARRYQEVSCSVAGRDQASFAAAARKKILETVKFTGGTYPKFVGVAEEQASARHELLMHSLLAGAGVLLLLAMVFRRLRNLLLVLANLPFALVGGVLAVYFTEGVLSIGSLVGFVTLFGITTRNSIMMVSHFEHLVGVEGRPWGLETALRGASERLVPVLMTALVTALGLLPIALGSEEAGREIEGPMAIVILGGLATSTLLNLLVLPTLALRFGRFDRESEDEAPLPAKS